MHHLRLDPKKVAERKPAIQQSRIWQALVEVAVAHGYQNVGSALSVPESVSRWGTNWGSRRTEEPS